MEVNRIEAVEEVDNSLHRGGEGCWSREDALEDNEEHSSNSMSFWNDLGGLQLRDRMACRQEVFFLSGGLMERGNARTAVARVEGPAAGLGCRENLLSFCQSWRMR